MLIDKFWLLPDGKVIDVTSSEHAIFARKQMLQLRDDDRGIDIRNMLSPLSAAEIETHRCRGIPEDVLQFLSVGNDSNDPRLYVIFSWGWIRGRFTELKSPGFWVSRVDDASLRTIRGATDFWSLQKQLTEFDVVNLTELITDACYQVPVTRLRNPNVGARELIDTAFRKPNLIDDR